MLAQGWRRLAGSLGLVCSLGLANGVSAAAPLPPFREFAIEAWAAEKGLPQNTATAVIQNRRGYIWVGTYNGIAEFDGLRFKIYNAANTPGLANSRITCLAQDSRGGVWIGHDTGEVSHFADGAFSAPASSGGAKRNPIKAFIEDDHGDLWAMNQLGEARRLRDGRLVTPTGLLAENPFVNPEVVTVQRGQPYVLRNGCVARFTPEGYVPVDFGDEGERPYYLGLAAARDGHLWVLGQGRLRKWDGSRWVADFGEFAVADVSVTTMRETIGGRLVVGTLSLGLLIFEPGRGWSSLDRNDGLPQDWVVSLTEDRERNLWVGTAGGLALLRARKVQMLNPPDAWQGRPVLSIAQTSTGDLWAGTEGAGIYRLRGEQWTSFSLSNQFVWAVLADAQDQIWAGTWGGGVFRFADGQFVVATNQIPSSNSITALKEWPLGTTWIGTGAGLFRRRGDTLESFIHLAGAASGDVRAVESGETGDEVWFGTQGSGLGYVTNGQVRTFLAADGAPGNFIISLCRDTEGTLWIGTLDQGLGRYRDGRFAVVSPEHGLPAKTIYHIEDDHLGHLWFNSPVGIFRVSKQQLHAAAEGNLEPLDVLAYGKAEGMTTLTGTGGFTPSGFRTPDGQLWFSTSRGIAVVNPRTALANPLLPPVWIEEVQLDGHPVPHQSKLQTASADARPVVIPPGRRQLEIAFTALSFTAPERVRFKYRLEGMDAEWTEGGALRRVTYSFLPPGRYVFRVIACNSDGLWNEAGDAVELRVQPHFWQTLLFKLLLGLLACVLVGGLVHFLARQRHRRKLERIGRERALERERARIAQDIHDDLGASLTRISLLSESAAGDPALPPRTAANLDHILDTARELTRSMDEIVWAVNPRHDTLESLTNYISRYAQDFLSAAAIRCRLAVPLELPDRLVRSEVRHNLFLACKEALHNVVKHAHATEVRLTLELVRGGLKFSITDNGPGFDPAAPRPADSVAPGHGNGLRNLETRLRQIGGHSKFQSAPGAGSTVEFFVPLAESP
jgi:signal transduction histidine kinase/ligand-binding sensor domain-containing protein